MAIVGNGEKNRTDIRRRSGNVPRAIFFHQKHDFDPLVVESVGILQW